MIAHDRRLGYRVPMEMFMNQYMEERSYRTMTVNISETGIYMNKVIAPILRTSRVVGLEFELPGTNEQVWARGEICYDSLDELFHGQGVRFTAMPVRHRRLLRDYCVENRRARLANMLDRIRRSRNLD